MMSRHTAKMKQSEYIYLVLGLNALVRMGQV